MAYDEWMVLRCLSELLPTDGATQTLDPKLDRHVTAAMDTVIDLIPQGRGTVLLEGARQAKELHDRLFRTHGTQPEQPAYLAGRLAALTDVLALAAQRCVVDPFTEVIRKDHFAGILRELLSHPLTNTELAARIGETSESVCRKLRDLRGVGAVLSHRDGRETVNSLSPAARAYLSDHPDAVPRPIQPYDMRKLPAPPSHRVPATSITENPHLDPCIPCALPEWEVLA